MKQNPTFDFEEAYWNQGILSVAGIDEVGMGALAGPVVAAAVIFTKKVTIKNLRDSKKLSASQREEVAKEIQSQAVAFAIGEASVEEINELNIRRASHVAMRRALESLSQPADLVLLDGLPAKIHDTIPTHNIIKGDQLCCSIAAASIIAKVYRDALMMKLDEEFPAYGFAGHKGYGSPAHLAALHEHGATIFHRAAYAPVAAAIAKMRI